LCSSFKFAAVYHEQLAIGVVRFPRLGGSMIG
jgi:hypothetical protein